MDIIQKTQKYHVGDDELCIVSLIASFCSIISRYLPFLSIFLHVFLVDFFVSSFVLQRYDR